MKDRKKEMRISLRDFKRVEYEEVTMLWKGFSVLMRRWMTLLSSVLSALSTVTLPGQ